MPEITLSPNRSGMTPPLVTGTLIFAAKRSRYAEENAVLPPTVSRVVTNGVLASALNLEPLTANLYWYASFVEGNVVTWDEDIYIPPSLTGTINFDDLQTARPIITIRDGVPIIQGPKGDPGPAGTGNGGGGNTVYTYSVNAVSLAKNTVTHGLGTTDVVVQVVTITTGEVVDADIRITSANTIEVGFATAPVADTYRITVIGAGYTNSAGGPGTYSGSSYLGTVNRITHGLGSVDVLVQVNDTATGEVVEPDVRIVNQDTIEVYWGTAVNQNQYRILVFGGSSGGEVTSPTIDWGEITGDLSKQLDLANRLEQIRAVLGDYYDLTNGQLQFSRPLEDIFPGSSFLTELTRIDNSVDSLVDGSGRTPLRAQETHQTGTLRVAYPNTFGYLDTSRLRNFTASYLLQGNISALTLPNPPDVTASISVRLLLTQDGTGGRTLPPESWGAQQFRFPGGIRPVLSTAPGAVDLLTFEFHEGAWYLASFLADMKA